MANFVIFNELNACQDDVPESDKLVMSLEDLISKGKQKADIKQKNEQDPLELMQKMIAMASGQMPMVSVITVNSTIHLQPPCCKLVDFFRRFVSFI